MKEGDRGTVYHYGREDRARVTMVKCDRHIMIFNEDLSLYSTFHKAAAQIMGRDERMVPNKLVGMWVRYPRPFSDDVVSIFILDEGQCKSIDRHKIAKLLS